MTAVTFLLVIGGISFLMPFLHVAVMLYGSRTKKTEIESKKALDPADNLRQAVATVRVSLAGEQVPEARMKVERLEQRITALRSRLPELGPSTYHTVVATGTKYLPDAVNAYLQLPRAGRDTVPVDGQKTAKELLCEQLDIMNAELKEILDEAEKVDATNLIVHGRFLEEKFGKAEPVVEDVPADLPVTATNAGEIILSSRIQTSTSGDRWEMDADGVRQYSGGRLERELRTYRPQDHRDCEEFLIRSASGEVVSRYCDCAGHCGNVVLPEARYHVPGELPDEPKWIDGPIPKGTYPVEVVNVETQYSQMGRKMFALELVITSGEFAGYRLWKKLVIAESRQGLGMFFNQMAVLGLNANFFAAEPDNHAITSELLGRRAQAHVKIDSWHERQRNVVDWLTPARASGTVGT